MLLGAYQPFRLFYSKRGYRTIYEAIMRYCERKTDKKVVAVCYICVRLVLSLSGLP